MSTVKKNNSFESISKSALPSKDYIKAITESPKSDNVLNEADIESLKGEVDDIFKHIARVLRIPSKYLKVSDQSENNNDLTSNLYAFETISHDCKDIKDVENILIDYGKARKYITKLYLNGYDYREINKTGYGFKYLLGRYNVAIVIDSNMKIGHLEMCYFKI